MSLLPVDGLPGAANPWAPHIDAYENGQYGYDVQTVKAPRMYGQNFDLQRQRALGAVNAGVQSGTSTALQSLMGSGGLSAADKKALLAQSQRQRVNLAQGAMAPLDQMQAQNLYDVQKYNVDAEQKALDLNQGIMNRRAMDMATAAEDRAVSIYQQRLKEAMLQRQVSKARELSQG